MFYPSRQTLLEGINHGLQVKSSLLPVFIKKVLLKLSHFHLLTYFLWLLSAIMIELNSYNRDHMAQKAWNAYLMVIYGKNLLIPNTSKMSSIFYCSGQKWQSFSNPKSFSEQMSVASFQFIAFKYWFAVCHLWASSELFSIMRSQFPFPT